MVYSIFSPFHISHSSFFKLIFSLQDNYNIVVFAIHQYELATGAHVFLHPEPPSHLLSHPIPLSCPRAPALSALLPASELHWSSISHMVIYMLQCYSHNSSHPCLLPQSPKTCSLYLCLFCYFTYRYFDDDYSDCSKAIPHCSFDCISQIMSDVEQPFMSSVAIVCLLWRNVCLVLLSIFLLG